MIIGMINPNKIFYYDITLRTIMLYASSAVVIHVRKYVTCSAHNA